MISLVDRAAFWEFKARCAELDLEIVKLRMKGEALAATKNQLLAAFARAHGLDPMTPITLDDVALTAAQE